MIETERLFIRKHLPGDWLDLFEYLSLPEIYNFEPGEPITKEQAKNLSLERSKGNTFFPVVLRLNNKMIGHLYFNQTEPLKFLTWEIGYIFNPKYYNKGYATESVKAIIRYGFTTLHAHKIVAYCNPNNIASVRVLEKAGMQREGYFKEKAFFRKDKNDNPIWHDCVSFGILQ